MSIRPIDAFKKVFKGKRLLPEKEPGPLRESPDLQDDDINFILSEHILRKYGDREYYGPGADEDRAEKERKEKEARQKKVAQIHGEKRQAREENKSQGKLGVLMQKIKNLKKEIEKYEEKDDTK